MAGVSRGGARRGGGRGTQGARRTGQLWAMSFCGAVWVAPD